MAVADLNAYARPYLRRPNHSRLSPLQPPPPVTAAYYYDRADCQPPLGLVPNYSHPTFPEHRYHPLRPQPNFFRNHAPSPPHHHRRGDPSGLMFPNNRGGVVCEKLFAQAMYRYDKARAPTAGEGRREPPHGPRRRGEVACGPRAWTRGRGKVHVPVARAGRVARSPSPAFTTRPETWIPPPPWLGLTTVMIRNIPNKLTRAAMMELLDDHCARENRRRRGGRAAAYDFIYVPMDFSMQESSNKGYAFVNFTTADAARGLHFALHGCGWKPWVGSRKTVHVDAAYVQGKRRLVMRRFSRSTFVCRTDEFLPAAFWPPCEGAAHTAPRHLGLRLPPLPAGGRGTNAAAVGVEAVRVESS